MKLSSPEGSGMDLASSDAVPEREILNLFGKGFDSMKSAANPSLLPLARQLRKNMTKEERCLWYDFLRNYPVKFRKQTIIGNYIVDFFCHEASLVVELDGSQHCDPETVKRDQVRTDYLNSHGLTVLRISNRDIHENFSGVCEYIDLVVKQSIQHP